jgi:hypothetical protein
VTLFEVSEHCASLRRGYRADLVRVTSFGYVTIEVYRAGGLLASSTAQDVASAMFADLPS